MDRVSSGTILLAFIAVLCGLLGVYTVRQALKRNPRPSAEAPARVVIPMASRRLAPGQTVTLGDVALVRMTRTEMKAKGVSGMFMADPDQIIGRTLRQTVSRGSTFDTENFYPDGTRPGIVDRLKPGERAITVSIHGIDALVGFAGAGQIVDVLFRVSNTDDGYHDRYHPWTARQQYNTRNRGRSGWRHGSHGWEDYDSRAVTLMQGVTVLALENNSTQTDQQNPLDKEEAIAVTLAVSPDQAEVLRVVEGNGQISLALRRPDDKTTFETIDAMTLNKVLGIKRQRPSEMEVYRGHRVETLVFDPDGELMTRYTANETDRAQPKESAANADDSSTKQTEFVKPNVR